jgi:hypothetical protein
MATTVTFEAHPTQVRPGEWCDRCAAPVAHSFSVAFAAGDLRHLGTVNAQWCGTCDSLTVTR